MLVILVLSWEDTTSRPHNFINGLQKIIVYKSEMLRNYEQSS